LIQIKRWIVPIKVHIIRKLKGHPMSLQCIYRNGRALSRHGYTIFAAFSVLPWTGGAEIYCAVQPPSTTMSLPVMKPASSKHRYRAIRLIVHRSSIIIRKISRFLNPFSNGNFNKKPTDRPKMFRSCLASDLL
jgi:hypothetical protein